MADWENVCGGLSSGTDRAAHLELKRLLDGAQLVLNPCVCVFQWAALLHAQHFERGGLNTGACHCSLEELSGLISQRRGGI